MSELSPESHDVEIVYFERASGKTIINAHQCLNRTVLPVCHKNFHFGLNFCCFTWHSQYLNSINTVLSKMGLELTELPSYLTDESLTREEKLEKMDDLKALHDEMVEKVAFFEMRCEYMDKQLRKNEKKKKKTNKKKAQLMPVKSSNYRGQNFDLKQFEPFEGEDPYLPDGWKTGWRKMDGFAKDTGSKIRVFWDPYGKFCYSRPNALKMMTNDCFLN